MRKKWSIKIGVVVLGIASLMAGGVKADSKEDCAMLDLLNGIEKSSVIQDGDYLNFEVTDENGTGIRFQGSGVAITEAGIVMEEGAMLFSLDYLGEIECIEAETADSTPEGTWIAFGAAYAEEAAVTDMTELYAEMAHSMEAVPEFVIEPMRPHGFLALQAEGELTLTKLVVQYDPSAEQITYSMLEGEALDELNGFQIQWNGEETEEVLEAEDTPEEAWMKQKLEQPNVLQSDIVAGIDLDSVAEEGDTTYFSSVMSDGTVVRFEGKHIAVSEEGIMIDPAGSVTSLDAVGKIYVYYATIGNEEQCRDEWLDIGYGYTYSAEKIQAEHAEEIHTFPYSGYTAQDWNQGACLNMTVMEPNFVYLETMASNEQSIVVSSLIIGYDPTEKVTGIRSAALDLDWYGTYLEGERYNAAKEDMADLNAGVLDFYLIAQPDIDEASAELYKESHDIALIPNKFYTVGDLKAADGTVLDKDTDPLCEGATLDIQIGDSALILEVPVKKCVEGAETMHDLVPYAYPDALGEKNTLVVPIIWADQIEMANEETLALYRKALGRVMDEEGNLTDYTDQSAENFSLSAYFDAASYGKLTVNSFMTDWYYSEHTFEEYEQKSADRADGEEILNWVKEAYPELDWTQFDQDANGYVDSIILINAGVSQSDAYDTISFGGAIHYRESYFGDYAGTQDDPTVNTFVTINHRFLQEENYNVLIHEFSHNFGIIDYYDVTYSGINAVGGFDMQSDNVGDWNAYSKLAVGWMEPQIVTGLVSGESVDLTIASSALTDDVIILPAAGTEYKGPFSEYVMIDLLTDDGVNVYDAAEYGLDGTVGVRISHVDARMEARTEEAEAKTDSAESAAYEIGTIHFANAYTGDGFGRYNIEVIQSGKKNTFTDLSNEITKLTASDLFYEGDEFTAEDYSAFFYNGQMDDGKELGYIVKIVSIGTDENGQPNAVIRITAK